MKTSLALRACAGIRNMPGVKGRSGGARPGAGRPTVRPKRAEAAAILGSVDEAACWRRLLHSDDDRIALDALKYLTDRRDGKAAQAVSLTASEPIKIVFDL